MLVESKFNLISFFKIQNGIVPGESSAIMTVQISSDGIDDFLSHDFSTTDDHGQLKNGGQDNAGHEMLQPAAGSSSDLQPIPLTVESSSSEKVKKPIRKPASKSAKTARKSGRKVRTKAVEDKSFKRGQYANYGPALRAEIAKFASTHGNQVQMTRI